MSKKILLVGCGQLGSRHLQAVASLNEISEINIIDVSNDSLEIGKSRVKELSDINKNIRFCWLNKIEDVSKGGDLCIVATQAKGRCQIVKQIAQQLGYKNFLIEKIVSQSMEEYLDLMDFAEKNDISIWVNCKSRGYSVHKHIKSKLDPDEPIIFSAVGGNHGLANNGVHTADLFLFHDVSQKIHGFGSYVDPILHKSKRGSAIFDLSGTICGYSDKGSQFTLSFASDHTSPEHISIVSSRCRFIVDHLSKTAYESYADSKWEWNRLPFEDNFFHYVTGQILSFLFNKRLKCGCNSLNIYS